MKLSEAYAIVKKKLDAAEVPYRYFNIVVQAHQFRYTRKDVFSKLEYYVKIEVHFEEEIEENITPEDEYYEYMTIHHQIFAHFTALFTYLDSIAPIIDLESAKEIEV